MRASPDVSNMLNQVIAGPDATQEVPTQSSSGVSDLLNQVIAGPDATQEVPAQPSTQGSNAVDRKLYRNKPAPEDNLLEMLSDVCGEQKEDD